MILTCLTITLVTLGSYFGSDERDFKSLKRSEYVCRTDKRYGFTPCLTRFIKREDGVYWAICGYKKIGGKYETNTTRR